MQHHCNTSGSGPLMEPSPHVSPMRLSVLRRKLGGVGRGLCSEGVCVCFDRGGKNSGSGTQWRPLNLEMDRVGFG